MMETGTPGAVAVAPDTADGEAHAHESEAAPTDGTTATAEAATAPTPSEVSAYTRRLWTAAVQHMSAQVAAGKVDAFTMAPLLSGAAAPDPAPTEDDELDSGGAELQFTDGTTTAPRAASGQAASTGTLAWGGHQNGRIPKAELTAVKVGKSTHYFEANAARAFQRMQAAAAADGVTIGLTDSYRDHDTQVRLRQEKGHRVATATPGTSVHGWGKAIDVSGADARKWIQEHGAEYGWHWPAWARRKGKSYEPWHFEFRGTGKAA